MKKLISLATIMFTSAIIMSACGGDAYGEKVEINDKSEVYIKDGATKEEAQALGNFLLKNNYFDNVTERSVQLQKDNDIYVVKFIVNEEKLQNEEDLIIGFRFYQPLLRDSVFAGKPTKVVLTDGRFNEIKSIKGFSQEELENEFSNDHDSLHVMPDTTTVQ